MDEVRLKDELMARLANELDRPALQVIDGALSAVLRNYEVEKRETGLSTDVISFPELEIFIGKMRFDNYSSSTINQYRRFLTDLLIYVGKPVQDITGEDVVECLNNYEQVRQISASTKDHKRRIASSFFAFLHDRGYIHKNPMATVDPIKYIAEVREALSPREMEKMRIACGENIRDNAVLELFLATGCRVSEVVNMRLENLDLQAGYVKVIGKGQKERIVFFSDRALEYLEQYLGDRRTGAVILSNRAPHQGLKKNALENIIRQIAMRAGIGKRVFPHLLRHTFATRALNKGMPLPTLSDLMGHSSVETTRIYAKNGAGKMKYEYDMYAAG
ncbi:tyrosine-type recombinase/integrase [Hungatella hathewayi]|uniref:tyrosine-type recombinase/integrase n=1 Tax=Hungatella hathewayi TaxID=154046 RepID=UPI002109D3F9|nr:tyrosine-type recombinase/integrase [Hungatella hathewayi]MCQ5384258.1 tyrosine-type recombinase/integrase [Hungatella hathewayi]